MQEGGTKPRLAEWDNYETTEDRPTNRDVSRHVA